MGNARIGDQNRHDSDRLQGCGSGGPEPARTSAKKIGRAATSRAAVQSKYVDVVDHGASMWRGLGSARAWARVSARQWTLLVVVAVVVTRLPGLFVSFFGEDEATYSALGAR